MRREDESPLDEFGDDIEARLVRNLPRPALAHLLDLDVYETTREIFITSDINDDFGGWFTKVFRRLLILDPEAPITVWLDTPGGDEQGMLVFYDLVTTSPAPVTIVGSGSICSAGVLMLACGQTRLVTENCTLMSHESRGLGGPDLRHSEAKDRRKWEDWLHERWFELMGRCTAPHKPEIDAAFWKRVTNRKAEFWLLEGSQIIDHGIADWLYSYDRLPDPARGR